MESELSPRSRKLLSCFNLGLQAQIQPLSTQVAGIAGQLSVMSTSISNLDSKVEGHGQHLAKLDKEIEEIRASAACGSTAAPSSAGSGGPVLGGLGGGPYAATPFVPKGQRTMVVVGGFPQDGRREDIERAIKTLCKDIPGLRDSYPVGRRPQIFKMEFGESRAMWNWLKSTKGRKLEWEGRRLWHTIEKSQEEMLMSKKVGFLLDKLRTALGISPE